MKDTKRKAHELAAIVESVAGILFDTPEPETEPKRKTARWKRIGDGTDRFYCSACNVRANIYTRDGDLVDVDLHINGWRFCPWCGADMRDDER